MDLKSFKKKNLGLVLEGGGVRGAYQFGAIKALLDAGFAFSAITGTSIGAINGALLVQGGYKKLSEFWQDISASKIYDIDDDTVAKASNLDFDFEWAGKVSKIFRTLRQTTASSSLKMRSYFSSFFDEEKIRASKIDFGLVTYSISDFKPMELFKEEIPQGQLVDFLLASAYYPVYGYHRIDKGRYIDGGIWDNLPINLLSQKGYKDIIAIRTKQKPPRRKLSLSMPNVFYITPSADLGRAIYFTKEKIKENEQRGYFDTLRFLKGYTGKKYYFDKNSAAQVVAELKRIETYVYTELIEEIIAKEILSKGMAIQIVASIIIEELKLKQADVASAYLTLFELFAAFLRVEPYTIYSVKQLLALLSKKTVSSYDSLPVFVKSAKAIKSLKLKEIFYKLACALA